MLEGQNKTVFTSVLQLLIDENYVKYDHYFVDGTKGYTFVWGKAVVKQKQKLQEKVQSLFTAIEEAEKQEDQALNNSFLPELGEASTLTSEKLEQAVQQLENRLQEKSKE